MTKTEIAKQMVEGNGSPITDQEKGALRDILHIMDDVEILCSGYDIFNRDEEAE